MGLWGDYFGKLVRRVEGEGIVLVDRELYVRSWNRGAEALTGLSRSEVLKSPLNETGLLYPSTTGPIQRTVNGRPLFINRFELPVDDGWKGLLINGSPPPPSSEDSPVLERENAILEKIASGSSLPLILTEVARMLEDQLPDFYCSVLLVDECVLRVVAAPSLPKGYNAIIDGLEIGPGKGSCGAAAYTGERVFTEDIENDPAWEEHRDRVLPYGLRACWSTPIRSTDGSVIGTFAIYSSEPGLPGEEFAVRIRRAERLVSLAVRNDTNLRELQRSEEHLRLVLEHVGDALFLHGQDGKILDVNPQACRSLGYSRQELLGRSIRFIDEDYKQEDLDELLRKLNELTEVVFESRHVRKDGSSFPVEVRIRPFEGEEEGSRLLRREM